ncbi:hypothetical protein GCM10011519_33870 [Marmoricola endophyticus]|uniref:Glucose/Sorbosone dehydrogenase domain-containing protein n=1 Tax=Marmoricola endophyticus TaxID=2040280 RepID=A0A917BUG6_9ACTN|nr:PQQ-dependent sugar dehydrogenase [Marmoricola endophyticus]GGF57139.1 hypothetical protein GCM10011519_33870 [Marmoricola endophyticus]
MDRRSFLRSSLAVPAAGAVALAVESPARAGIATQTTLASGMTIPWGLDFLPDHSALVTERDSAQVFRILPYGAKQAVGSVPGVQHGGEGGLLGLAVSPTYAQDKRVYLYYTTASDNRVVWTTYDAGRLGTTFTPVVTGIPRGTIHNGGSLLFTSYGSLLVGCGETGNRAYSQNLGSLGGKILQVTRDGRAWGSNPLVGRAGDDRILTWGHRNPQGLAQNTDGLLWSAELGQDTYDELNQIRGGRNYGWPNAEGSDGKGGYTDPLAQWTTAECSPSGVACLGGRAWIGGLRGQALWSVDLGGARRGRKVRFLQGTYGRIRNVKKSWDGALWITTSNGGSADRVVRLAF